MLAFDAFYSDAAVQLYRQTASRPQNSRGHEKMAAEGKGETSGQDVPGNRPSTQSGPFVLRTLLDDVPLSADGGGEDIKINCVDYLGI